MSWAYTGEHSGLQWVRDVQELAGSYSGTPGMCRRADMGLQSIQEMRTRG